MTRSNNNYRTALVAPMASDSIREAHSYEYDNNGNIVHVNTQRLKPDMTVQPDTVQRAREERFRWDEENRLAALSQNVYVSHYWYDADGERDKRTVPVSQPQDSAKDCDKRTVPVSHWRLIYSVLQPFSNYIFMSWHEIVKYRPENYDENGAYKANEWTSFSDIGKSYDGKVFTLENYLRVEQRYIAVILSIMSRMDCKYLTVEYLEVDKNDIEKQINSNKDHTTDSLLVTSLIQLEQGKRIYYKNIDNVIRLALREYIYIVLCNKQKKLKIEFGYDYYLYVLCNLDNRILNNLVNSVGLYLDPRG